MVLIALVFFSVVKTEEDNVLHGYGGSIRDGVKEMEEKRVMCFNYDIHRALEWHEDEQKHYLIKYLLEKGSI